MVVGPCCSSAGVVCMATKRNALGVLMGIELVLNGANVNFVAFGSEFLQADRAAWPWARRAVDRAVCDRAGGGRSRRGPGHRVELLQQPCHGRRRPGRRVEGLMEPSHTLLPLLLVLAWLLPLASFTLIVLFGPRMGKAGTVRRLRGHRGHRRWLRLSSADRPGAPGWPSIARGVPTAGSSQQWLRRNTGMRTSQQWHARSPANLGTLLGQFGTLKIAHRATTSTR